MDSTTRVAVIMGGPSDEHPVSLKTGAQVLSVLRDPKIAVRIEKDGCWNVGGEDFSTVGAALDALKERADVVFIGLHGPFGEDGRIQALLEAVGLPYVGSGVAASALAMDKARAKLAYRAAGLPTPDSVMLMPWQSTSQRQDQLQIADSFGYPVVLKPFVGGSSFGVSFPASRADLEQTCAAGLERGQELLVEKRIVGTELTCGVLALTGEAFALPVTEIVPGEAFTFFDYEAKYTPGATDEITPARIDDKLRDRVQQLALQAHHILGCRHLSRTDFMVHNDEPLVLETNTLPGFTETSLLPQAAEVFGLSFEKLVEALLDAASS